MSNTMVETDEPACLLFPREAAASERALVGGKAFNLSWLCRNGYRVPDWFVFTSTAVETLLKAHGLRAHIETTLRTLPDQAPARREVLQRLRAEITALSLSDEVRASLAEALASFSCGMDTFVAVRSSVADEDGASVSFAGQMDSFLFQKGPAAVERSVLRCIASAFSERAVAYRRQVGRPLADIRTAVVVQEMVEGSVSGVLFTAHPATGSRRQTLLTACYGLGEGLVSGQVDGDEFTVGLDDEEVTPSVRTKTEQVVFDWEAGLGTRTEPVPAGLQEVPCLSEAQVREVVRVGLSVAARKGAPQDVEWTLREGTLYVLQTRPITTLPPAAPAGRNGRIVWDNSNIQESYCGVTTPLTYSFARRAYATVYEQTMRVVGLPEAVIQAHRPMLDNLLGFLKGRIYYHIDHWYRGLLLLPSFSRNKADMEQMMGLQDPVDFVEDDPAGFAQKLRRLPGLFATLLHLLYRFSRLDRLVADFEAHFEAEYARIDRGRLHTMDLAALAGWIDTLRGSLLMQWTTPILNDFFVMMMNGRVRRRLERLEVDNPALLQNRLLSGEPGLESIEPTRRLLALCEEIRRRPAMACLFETLPAERLPAAVQAEDPVFYGHCLDYLERYGDRGAGELKLETVTPRQRPALLFAQLRGLLERPDLTPETLVHREQRVRREAEAEAFAHLRGGPLARYGFRRDLDRLRKGIRYRESTRMARTRMFGLFRDLYLEIGRRLAFEGVLDEPRDVFYLTTGEIDDYIGGRAVQADLKALCRNRRAEYARYEDEELPHHFYTWGAPYHHNTYRYPHAAPRDAVPARTLHGTGCYPGVVEETVEVVSSPEAIGTLRGRILCTVRTDPGWAPLFPTASGLLIERGSTLSHSAIVARELGIPAIVGIPELTRRLRTGERVRMDGAAGTVERLDLPASIPDDDPPGGEPS